MLALLVLGGGLLRLSRLEGRELGHIEVFTPGIDLPEFSVGPPPRRTVAATLSGSLWEPHPPGWYLSMLAWTSAFGQDLETLRLPSVLAGTLTIGLLAWLALLEGGWICSVLVAGLLALHGHHLFWSQLSRPYALVCGVAVASSLCLLLLTRGRGRPAAWLVLYLALVGYGLGSLYYFWVVFAAHMLWVALSDVARGHAASGLLRWQALVLLLASPLVTLASFQAKRSNLEDDVLGFGAQFLQFGFSFEVDRELPAALPAWQGAGLAVIFLALVVASWRRRGQRDERQRRDAFVGPGLGTLALVAALATATMLALARVLTLHRPFRRETMLWTSLLPLALLAAVWSFDRLVPRANALFHRLGLRGTPSLVSVLALVPFPLVAAVSLYKPFLASRNMLLFTPFLLLLAARGVVAVSRRGGQVSLPRLLPLVMALGLVFGASARNGLERPGAAEGFRDIAAAWRPKIEPEDLIYVQEHFYTSPIFYYLQDHRSQLVGDSSGEALAGNAGSRVWVFRLEGRALTADMLSALSRRSLLETMGVNTLRVDLHAAATDAAATR